MRRPPQGFLLLTALYVFTACSLLVAVSLTRSLTDLGAANLSAASHQAFYLAEAGMDDELSRQSKTFTQAEIAELLNAAPRTSVLPTGSYTVDYVDDGDPNNDVVVLISTGTSPIGSGTASKTLRVTFQLPTSGLGVFEYAIAGSKLNIQASTVVGDRGAPVPLYITGSNAGGGSES
jgi:hypothetical protein